jgi:hypothetical protein
VQILLKTLANLPRRDGQDVLLLRTEVFALQGPYNGGRWCISGDCLPSSGRISTILLADDLSFGPDSPVRHASFATRIAGVGALDASRRLSRPP